jgi:hypothetical protein
MQRHNTTVFRDTTKTAAMRGLAAARAGKPWKKEEAGCGMSTWAGYLFLSDKNGGGGTTRRCRICWGARV